MKVYRLGARAPANAQTIPLPYHAQHVIDRYHQVRGGADAVMDTTVVGKPIANFITGLNQDWDGYYDIGAEGPRRVLKLPPVPPHRLVPGVNAGSSSHLDPKARGVDYYIWLKRKTEEELGVYTTPQGTPIYDTTEPPNAPKKFVPLTTPALMVSVVNWLLTNNKKGQRGWDPRQEQEQLRLARIYRTRALAYADAIAKQNGFTDPKSEEYQRVLRGMILPFKYVDGFWPLFGKFVIRLDSNPKGHPLWSPLGSLAQAFWDRTVVSISWVYRKTKKAVKAVGGLLSWLWKHLKWILIGVAGIFALILITQFRGAFN